MALGYVPGASLAPGGFARLFRIGPRVGIEGLPAVFGRQIAQGTTLGIRHLADLVLDGYRIGGAYLRTDLAAHARGNLNRCQHHPCTLRRLTRDRTLSL